jgi:HK97 family phage prohead protease
MDLERRYFTATELRASAGQTPRLAGHAAVFNQLSDDLGGYREKILPGAFAETIKDGDVRALWNHDANFVLARTKSGTLKLKEDNTGLAIDAELPDTQFARDLIKTIERGDVDQMSFGFRVLPDGQNWRMEDGGLVRELRKVELFDVSPVTYPAYPQTDVGVRALAEEMRGKLSAPQLTESDKLAAAQRMQQRLAFIQQRTPRPDPLSLSEILKNAKIV